MQLHTFANLLLLTNTVTADYLTAKSHRTGNNINLGHFSDVAAFHSVIGGQNGTSWEDITEYETFEDQAQPQSQSSNPSDPEATGLIRRADDYCSDLTGVTRMVCDNVPSRNWFWGAGGTLLIVYAPRTLERFLNDIARAIQAGRNLRRVIRGGHDELKRVKVNDTNAINYHFSLPYLLDHEGKPEYSSMRHGDLKARNYPDADADLKHDYVYSQRDEVIYYKATSLSFSPKDVAPAEALSQNETAPAGTGTGTLQARGRTRDYTINMIITKHSSVNTQAKPSCLAKMLKYHLDASSKKGRFSCRPIDNKGKWHATMHLMINHGSNNKGTYGKCCD